MHLLISGVPLGEACSIVLRGATEQIIGEAERSLHDALCVLTSTVKETKTTFGGGMYICTIKYHIISRFVVDKFHCIRIS